MTFDSVEIRSAHRPVFDLERARINKGHSIKGLARQVQVHEQTIRRIENGLPVRPESAKPVADYFGVKVTDLIPIEGDAA